MLSSESGLRWIQSNGGPLLCAEPHVASRWRGFNAPWVHGDFVFDGTTDYERACAGHGLTRTIDIFGGTGLVLNTTPMSTAVSRDRSGCTIILRVEYADFGMDYASAIASLPADAFSNPVDRSRIVFISSKLMIFDSAFPGDYPELETLTFNIEPGLYEIRSIAKVEERFSWVISQLLPLRDGADK